MQLIRKGHVGDVWFKVEKYQGTILFTIGNKPTEKNTSAYAQVFFSSEEELNLVLKTLLGEFDTDD